MRICEVCRARYRGTPTTCPLDGGRLIELPDPLLGRTIAGRYLITHKIGAGGMGTVYRARHEIVGRDVAVKFLLPDLALDQTSRTRFLREAKAANRIDHDHIIDITDYGETDDGLVYLVMEFLEGRTLADEMRRGPLGVARAVDIAMQCASALARAHELDVVHRDIKPTNIFLVDTPDRRDCVKVLDFGLAHIKGELRLTATGAVFGTPEYMAPEQARGAPLTGLADLYALGCVLFEMLTGSPPFRGSTPDLILQHMREPPPLASKRAPGVPPELDALVRRLMDKDPRRRHRDGYHLLEELRQIAERLPKRRAASADDVLDAAKTIPRALDSVPALPVAAGGPQIGEAWAQRTALFRQLMPRAHLGAPVPSWLVAAVDELDRRVAEGRALEAELARIDQLIADREQEIRGFRQRLGRAIDELGRDESRALGDVDELTRRAAELQAAIAPARAGLARAMGSVRAATDAAVLTVEVAAVIRDAGQLAARWLDAESAYVALTNELRRRERDRDDLRFQISQMKGRLAGAQAEQDADLGSIRERSAQLDAQRSAQLETMAAVAARVAEYFAAFPELRDLVERHAPPPSRTGPRSRSDSA